MNKITTMVVVGLSVVALAGCTEREKGTLLGATVGGIMGSVVGKGQGHALAVGLGAMSGMMFGQHIGDQLDKAQAMKVEEQLSSSLEYNYDGQPSWWEDPNTTVGASAVPLSTFQTAQGQYCREFQQEIVIDGIAERAYGTACRQPDGSWEIIS